MPQAIKISLPDADLWTLDAGLEAVGKHAIRKVQAKDAMTMQGDWVEYSKSGTGGYQFTAAGLALQFNSANLAKLVLYTSSRPSWERATSGNTFFIAWQMRFNTALPTGAAMQLFTLSAPPMTQHVGGDYYAGTYRLYTPGVLRGSIAAPNPTTGVSYFYRLRFHNGLSSSYVLVTLDVALDAAFNNIQYSLSWWSTVSPNFTLKGIVIDMVSGSSTYTDILVSDVYVSDTFASTGPMSASTWLPTVAGVFGASTFSIITNHLVGLSGGASSEPLFQYAVKGGALNGVNLTLAQLITALAGQATENRADGLKLAVVHTGNTNEQSEIGGLGTHAALDATESGAGVYPSTGKVIAAEQYGPTGVEYTGTYVEALESKYQDGQQYGVDGTSRTGTKLFSAGAGSPLEVIELESVEVIEV